MHFFLFDFALAFIALLGYRAVAAVTRDRVAAVSLVRRQPLRPAPDSQIVWHGELPLSRGGGTMACCGERAPHRLINFW